jgi:hypothetical protein
LHISKKGIDGVDVRSWRGALVRIVEVGVGTVTAVRQPALPSDEVAMTVALVFDDKAAREDVLVYGGRSILAAAEVVPDLEINQVLALLHRCFLYIRFPFGLEG